MDKILMITYLVLSLLTSSCEVSIQKTDHDLSDQLKSKVAGEVDSLMNYFFDTDHLNYTDQIALRANVDNYVFAIDGKITYPDYESYRAWAEESYSVVPKFIETKRPRSYIYVLAKDAASCTTEFQSKYLTINGDTIILNGCKTFVLKKFGEEWKIVQENGTHIKQ